MRWPGAVPVVKWTQAGLPPPGGRPWNNVLTILEWRRCLSIRPVPAILCLRRETLFSEGDSRLMGRVLAAMTACHQAEWISLARIGQAAANEPASGPHQG
jgi:hypothetical protein